MSVIKQNDDYYSETAIYILNKEILQHCPAMLYPLFGNAEFSSANDSNILYIYSCDADDIFENGNFPF